LGAELLRTDVIRQELCGAACEPSPANSGVYTDQIRLGVYDEMLRRATALHRDHISVVLDGTFSARDPLINANNLVSHPRGTFIAIECTCRAEVAHDRIEQRRAVGQDASEARPEIHNLQRESWESWPPDISSVRMDTEQPLDKQ